MRLLFLFTIISHFALAQSSNWANAGVNQNNGAIRTICVDSINNIMYIAGNTYDMGNVDSTRILYYQNGVWDTLPGYFNNIILSMTMFNGELYVGGSFDYINGIKTGSVVKWNGYNWISSNFDFEASVYNIKEINDTLYAMGCFINNGINCITKWDGNSWLSVYDIPVLTSDSLFCFIYDAIIYKNEFYVCGNFGNDTIEDFVKYNGESWVSAGDEIKGFNSQLTSLTIYKDELYLGGIINNGGGVNGRVTLAKYNGVKWSEVGISPDGVNSGIRQIKVHNDLLYVCGEFSSAGNVPINSISIWDNDKWCGFGGNFKYGVVDFNFYNDTLFVSCADTVDNIAVNGMAKWIGGSYIDTCSIPQSVQEISNSILNNIVIYPNPTNGEFNIKLNIKTPLETKIAIFSINGSKLFEKQFYQTNEIKINNLHLEKGVYFVKIKTDKSVITKKLIIN